VNRGQERAGPRGSKEGSAMGKRGYSTVGTLILISATLVVTVAATYVAYTVMEVQSQIAEHENAKSALVSVAELIESLSQSEGSAGYGRMYIRAGGLDMASGESSLTVLVNSWTAIDALPFTNIRYRGGRFVGGPDFSVLRGQRLWEGELPLIIPPSTPEVPLGWVCIKQEMGAMILLDFSRIRVSFVGTLNLSTGGTAWEPMNVVEIVFIRLLRGPTYGREVFNLRAQNKRIWLTTNRLQGTTFEIQAFKGETAEAYTLALPETIDGVKIKSTIFNVVVVDIEVGTQ